MPELPEVETIVRELEASDIIGQKITQAKIFWPRTVATADFNKTICGQRIEKISRRGKYIVVTLSKDTLLIHLRMTGKLSISNDSAPRSSHERLQLEFGDGRVLHYEDQRKFGKWSILRDPEEKFQNLGIEPLSKEFTLPALERLLKKSSQQMKPFLLNQKQIAGLGNIYVDEALFDAKIHPKQRANTLDSTQIKALYKAIPKVLEQGIAHMGTSLGSKSANYFSVSGRRGGNQTQLQVFRREGQTCFRCSGAIVKIRLAQRGTHLCPRCQKLKVHPRR